MLNLQVPLPSITVSGSISQAVISGPGGAVDSKRQFLLAFGRTYQEVIVAIQSSLTDVTGVPLPDSEKNCQSLKIKPPVASATNFKLGNRVKIRKEMKHRQFKQFVKAGWNEVMKADFGKLGTVVGLHTANPKNITVYFRDSDKRWTIDDNVLEYIEEEGDNDSPTYNNLKVGDYVEIDKNMPNFFIDMVQATYSLPAAEPKQFKRSLRKILAFTAWGAAIVSISHFESIFVHPHLLKKKSNRWIRPPNAKIDERFRRGKKHIIRRDISKMIFQPLWQYNYTQILGKLAVIEYCLPNNLLIVMVAKQFYLITPDYLDVEKPVKTENTRRIRKLTGESFEKSTKFPFGVHDPVQLNLADSENDTPNLIRLGVSLDLLQFIREEYGKVLGYDNRGQVAVEFGWPNKIREISANVIFLVPVAFLKNVPENVLDKFCDKLDKHEELKVGDSVSLLVAKHKKYVLKLLDQTLASDDVKQAMVSNAELVAFDDDKDRAILKYSNNRVFSCPTDFITVPVTENLETQKRAAPSIQQIIANRQEISKAFQINISTEVLLICYMIQNTCGGSCFMDGWKPTESGWPVFKIQHDKPPSVSDLAAITAIIKQLPFFCKIDNDNHVYLILSDVVVFLDIHPYTGVGPRNKEDIAEVSKILDHRFLEIQENAAALQKKQYSTALPNQGSVELINNKPSFSAMGTSSKHQRERKDSNKKEDVMATASTSNFLDDAMEGRAPQSLETSRTEEMPSASHSDKPQKNAEEMRPTVMQHPEGDREDENLRKSSDCAIEKMVKLRLENGTKKFTITGDFTEGSSNFVPSSTSAGANGARTSQQNQVQTQELSSTLGGDNFQYNNSNVTQYFISKSNLQDCNIGCQSGARSESNQ